MIEAKATPVYYHDCRALGPQTRLPRALMTSSGDDPVILYYHHKCPFCSQTAGEREFAKGVTPLADGSYSVDMKLAERLHA